MGSSAALRDGEPRHIGDGDFDLATRACAGRGCRSDVAPEPRGAAYRAPANEDAVISAGDLAALYLCHPQA